MLVGEAALLVWCVWERSVLGPPAREGEGRRTVRDAHDLELRVPGKGGAARLGVPEGAGFLGAAGAEGAGELGGSARLIGARGGVE